jgi:hypothetical protein
MLEEFREFRSTTGDFPSKETKLGKWAMRQGAMYNKFCKGKKCAMTKEKLTLLEDAGFVWADPNNKTWEDSEGARAVSEKGSNWYGYYKKLEEFQAREGHCNIPEDFAEDRLLYKWLTNQKGRYVRTKKRYCAKAINRRAIISF